MIATRAGLVGRGRERQVIADRLGAPGTRSAAIELVGEAGIGKSTLLDDAAAQAEALGHHTLRIGVTEAESALPWAGMVSLQPSLPPTAIDQLVEVQRSAVLAALGEAAPKLATAGPYVAAALRNILRTMAGDAPLLLVIDDLQWVDPATAGALAAAVRGSSDLPMTVIAASRADAVLPIELDRIVAHDHRRMVLVAFDDSEVHQLLRQRIDGRLSQPLLATVARLSGGNPLYTVLLGDHVAVDERIEHLPRSIVGSYLRRLDALSTATVDVLEHAAVLGRPEPEALVAACPERDVAAALLDAERAGLIAGPEEALQFVHPLMPSALSERLGTLGRDRIHRRLAEVLDDPELRAVHLAAATKGADPVVAAALDAAAQGARARGAGIEAAQRFERAGALTPPADVHDRWRRALAAADAYFGGGDLDRAAHEAAIADDLAANPVEVALAGGVMVQVVASRDGLHPAHDLVCSLLDRLSGQTFLRSFLARARARIEQTFDLEAALHTAVAAQSELAAAGDEGGSAGAAIVVENCRFVLGLPTDPLAAWEVARPDADPTDHLSVGWMAVEMLVWGHHIDAAVAALDHFERVCEARGNMLTEFKIHDFRASLALRQGDLALAERELRPAVDTAELTNYPASMAASGLACIQALTGRHREAAATLATIEPPSENLPLLHAGACNAHGIAASTASRWEEAVEHLQRAWDAAEKMGMGDLRALPFRSELTEALVRVGRVADAGVCATRVEELAQRCGAPEAQVHAARGRLPVLIAEGRYQEAIELGDRTMAMIEVLDIPIERCRVLLALGTAQRRAGRRKDAARTLAEARAVAVVVGLEPWRERIDEELGRLGGRRDPFELTATEAQVAELVARGRSNKEVANELFVSLRTVESNLTRIYRKLGIRSRAELAAGFRAGRSASQGTDSP